MKYILIITAIFLFNSCKKSKVKSNSISTTEIFFKDFNNTRLTDSLKKGIHKGDTIAYEKLKDIYYLSGHKNEFFFYSFYMAKNFKHIKAYNDCFSNLKHQYNNDNDVVLNKTTEYFLAKTYENTPEKIESSAIDFFGKKENIPKSDSILIAR